MERLIKWYTIFVQDLQLINLPKWKPIINGNLLKIEIELANDNKIQFNSTKPI